MSFNNPNEIKTSVQAQVGALSSVAGMPNVLPELEYRQNPNPIVDQNYRNALCNNVGALLVDPGVLTSIITDTAYAVDTTSVTLFTVPVACQVNPQFINNGSTIIYLKAFYGTSTATNANIPIAAGQTYSFPAIPAGQTIYAISSAVSGSVIAVTGV